MRVRGYLSTLGIPQRRPVDLINNIAPMHELVDLSLTARRQVEDEDAPAEIPERRKGRQWATTEEVGGTGLRVLRECGKKELCRGRYKPQHQP